MFGTRQCSLINYKTCKNFEHSVFSLNIYLTWVRVAKKSFYDRLKSSSFFFKTTNSLVTENSRVGVVAVELVAGIIAGQDVGSAALTAGIVKPGRAGSLNLRAERQARANYQKGRFKPRFLSPIEVKTFVQRSPNKETSAQTYEAGKNGNNLH